MTTFLLVRHGAHDLLGKAVAGRVPGVGLNASGLLQAQELVTRLHARQIDAVHCSPQQRARETVAPLAAHRHLPVFIDEAFDEVDFGAWSGLSFEQLRADHDRWLMWVDQKSVAAAPGGESFASVRDRAMAGIERVAKEKPDRSVLLVTHGDIIKAILASFLGIPLDHLERFDIAPASLSVIMTGPGWAQVKLVNG